MKKLMIIAGATALAGAMTGCCLFCSSGPTLSEEAKKNNDTAIWYDNTIILVKANDPDLKADSFIGVPALDAVVDTVKDILAQAPVWTVAKAEQMVFEKAYADSVKELNAGASSELAVKKGAFKCALTMDAFAQEVAHANAAVSLEKDAKKANYEQNEAVYEAAIAKTCDYANNQIYVLETCKDDAARADFFTSPDRKEWSARTDEIVAMIKKCIAEAGTDEASAKVAVAKLSREMGVQEFEWSEVGARLAGDLAKIQKAITDFASILQSDSDLQAKIAKAAFGGEIVEGVSGKETLAVMDRVRKQFTVTAELIAWLIENAARG